ncbi:DUF2573 family protein [Paenibacillus chartarius]|uniref:DUF2573 family protein n=1 Tax=Paenibacillus chartarius TaxID=747481 RepID=A0ABV6DF50_9BACL
MNSEFHTQFHALVEKLAELTTGDTSEDMIEKIKVWAIYNHIHKTMPALASHWSQSHPEARAEVRALFEEIRDKNQALRQASAAGKESE